MAHQRNLPAGRRNEVTLCVTHRPGGLLPSDHVGNDIAGSVSVCGLAARVLQTKRMLHPVLSDVRSALRDAEPNIVVSNS